MKQIAVVTATKDRPEQLHLVLRRLNEQTLLPDIWVIADDSISPLPPKFFTELKFPYRYIHNKRIFNTSTAYNTQAALSAVKAEQYICIDDDDCYPPDYVRHISSLLEGKNNEMVGNCRWPDYRLSTAHYRIRIKPVNAPDAFSEWRQSAFTGEDLKREIIDICAEDPKEVYVDHKCWKRVFEPGKFKCTLYDFDKNTSIGLKDYGIGNPGVIESHRTNDNLKPDRNLRVFREWLGPRCAEYEHYLPSDHQYK